MGVAEPELPVPAAGDREPARQTDEGGSALAGDAGEGEISEAELPRLIESLLFVASSPTPVAQLAQVFRVGEPTIEAALATLGVSCVSERRGLTLQRKGNHIQLTTVPEAGPHIERFLGLDLTTKLSQAALESLALIAYRQPITRAQIEAIRGVNCDGVLRTLLARGLVEPVGRLEQVGRPFLYGTTFQFLQYFGLESLQQLPSLPETEAPQLLQHS
jgi:segregation and condensation protein B